MEDSDEDVLPDPAPFDGPGLDEPEHLGPGGDAGNDDLAVDEATSLDDAVAADLDVGTLVAEAHDAPQVDPEATGVDSDGEEDEHAFDDAAELSGAETGDLGAEGAPEHDDEPVASPDDGGAEGMTDGTEGDIDEDALPDLDADAAGEVDLDDMLQQLGFTGDLSDPWVPAPGLAHEGPLAAVAVSDGRVCAVGGALVVLGRGELTPRARPLALAAHACAWLGSRTVFGTPRGLHFVSGIGEDVLAVPLHGVAELAVAAGRLFVRAGADLYRVDEPAGAVELVRRDAARVAASESTLFLLTAPPDGGLLALRGQDGDWAPLAAPPELVAHLGQGAALAVNVAGALASVDASRVLVARPGDRSARTADVRGAAAAIFAGDAPDAPLVVACADGSIVAVSRDGAVSDVGAAPEAPRSLGWDGSRDTLFLAGAGGLQALAPRVRH